MIYLINMELFNFFKTISVLITTVASSINFAVQQANNPVPDRPADTAQEFTAPPPPATPVDPRPLETQSIVGIRCDFANNNADSPDFKKHKYQRGSGVIVNVDGFILANRVVVDPAFYDADWEDYQLQECQAGPAPKEYRVPSDQELRTISPFMQVPVLSYVVQPVFAPTEVYISDYENDWLDFALLLITDLTPDAKHFGIDNLPKKFPYTPVLLSEIPHENDQLINFGYPLGTTIGLRATINTIFMQGLLSHVTKLWTGDQRFKDELFLLQSELDTRGGADGGRFGSPIFWKGYIVGIHTFKQDRSLNIYNLGIQPITDILQTNGITMFDDIY